MIKKWFNAKRPAASKNSSPNRQQRRFGDFEQLEDKRLLAFTGVMDGTTLDIVQTAADGPAVIENSTGTWTVTDNSGTLNLGTAHNIQLEVLDHHNEDVDLDLVAAISGSVSVDLGTGWVTLNMTGVNNSIGGDLNIQGGEFAQQVNLAVNQSLTVGGTATIDLSSGWDPVYLNGNGGSFANDLNLRGINNFVTDADHGLSIGGNFNFEVMDFINTQVVFEGVVNVEGNVNYYPSGSDTDFHSGTTREFRLSHDGSIGGNIYVNTGNGDDGDVNQVELVGAFNGSSIEIVGGLGTDEVTFGTSNQPAIVNVKLKSGDDAFKINPWTMTPESLRVDFGSGDDQFINDYGREFDFGARLLNLDGFNAFYDTSTGNLDINQVSDSGDIKIDNNGMNQEISYTVGGDTTTFSAANDIRLVLMDNTNTNVVTDFANPRIGNTVIQLRSGDREVSFEGSSNVYEGLLRIEAADGVQNVDVAVNADLNVDGTFIFNGRDGSDKLMAANSVAVSGAMLLRGVNNFVNNAGVDVDGDFNMISLLEAQDTSLISNAAFNVGGNFTYLGGSGVDAINFKSTGADIGGYTYVDLAESSDAFLKQRVILTGGFSTSNMVIDGSTAAAGNVFTTDMATTVTDGVIVNFAGNNHHNTASFFGDYGGTYGTYRGGSATDHVTFGADAIDMTFASLMGNDDDGFTIAPTAELDFLYVDFGLGNDNLDNQMGSSVPFSHNIFNM